MKTADGAHILNLSL